MYDTAYVIEVLARDLQHRNSDDKDMTTEREAVRKAVEYLAKTSHANSDPMTSLSLPSRNSLPKKMLPGKLSATSGNG